MLRNCRHKYFLIYVSFYVNCSEELDRCGVCFAKLIEHHVSACLVLHLIFTLRKLLVVTTCLFLTECFFWSYRKSWALLLIVSKPLSITWKYSVTGTVLFFFLILVCWNNCSCAWTLLVPWPDRCQERMELIVRLSNQTHVNTWRKNISKQRKRWSCWRFLPCLLMINMRC